MDTSKNAAASASDSDDWEKQLDLSDDEFEKKQEQLGNHGVSDLILA